MGRLGDRRTKLEARALKLATDRLDRLVHVRTVGVDDALHPWRWGTGRWSRPCRGAGKGEAARADRGACQDESQSEELHHAGSPGERPRSACSAPYLSAAIKKGCVLGFTVSE